MAIAYALLALAGLSILGFIKIRSIILGIDLKIIFLSDYRNKFIDLANTHSGGDRYFNAYNLNYDLANWLIANSVKAQK